MMEIAVGFQSRLLEPHGVSISSVWKQETVVMEKNSNVISKH